MNYIEKLETVTNFWLQQSKRDLEEIKRAYRVDLLPEDKRKECLDRLTTYSDYALVYAINLRMKDNISFEVLTEAASQSFGNLEKIASLYCKKNEGYQATKTALSQQREALSSLSLYPPKEKKKKHETSLMTTYVQGKLGHLVEKCRGANASRTFSFMANFATQPHDSKSEHPIRDGLVSAGIPVAIEEGAGALVEGPGFYVVLGADILNMAGAPLERKAKAYLRRPECQHHTLRNHENCSINETLSNFHPDEHCFDPCESAEALLTFAQTARVPGKLLKKTEHVAKEVLSSCLTKFGITGENLHRLLEKMDELETSGGYLPE